MIAPRSGHIEIKINNNTHTIQFEAGDIIEIKIKSDFERVIPDEVLPCDVCGEPSTNATITVTNNTGQTQNLSQLEQKVKYYCDQHVQN